MSTEKVIKSIEQRAAVLMQKKIISNLYIHSWCYNDVCFDKLQCLPVSKPKIAAWDVEMLNNLEQFKKYFVIFSHFHSTLVVVIVV